MNLDLSFYLAVFLRRLHYFAIVFVLVSAAAIAAAALLPAVYVSSSVVVVESSSIPNALDAPRVQAAAVEKLQTIQRSLMTRASLLEIARKTEPFQNMSEMAPDEIVQAMRDNTVFSTNSGRGQATFMTIEFPAESGDVAAKVVTEYVTRILSADVEMRTENAEGTLQFFEDDVARLSEQLAEMSAKILDFQNKNKEALPDTLTFRLSQQNLLQDRLATLERDIANLKDQKARMVAIFESTGQINTATTAQTPEAQQLTQLRNQLSGMLAVFSPSNPKVRMLQQQISQLEDVVKAQLPADASGNTATTMLDVQLADLDTRIAVADQERVKINEDLAKLKATIEKTPANQIELDALNREYANIQQQYNQSQSRLSQAAAGVRIELESKGERITLVEAASVPNEPTRPNRILIAGGGMGFGALLGVMTVILLELFNRAVRRPKDLIKSFGITPIITVPYMRTPAEARMRRTAFAAALLLLGIGIPALIYAVHVHYQPLDIIVAKFAAKLGIRL